VFFFAGGCGGGGGGFFVVWMFFRLGGFFVYLSSVSGVLSGEVFMGGHKFFCLLVLWYG